MCEEVLPVLYLSFFTFKMLVLILMSLFLVVVTVQFVPGEGL